MLGVTVLVFKINIFFFFFETHAQFAATANAVAIVSQNVCPSS